MGKWYTLPADDGNFKSRLQSASKEELNTALFVLESKQAIGEKHKSRIIAIKRQLKKMS